MKISSYSQQNFGHTSAIKISTRVNKSFIDTLQQDILKGRADIHHNTNSYNYFITDSKLMAQVRKYLQDNQISAKYEAFISDDLTPYIRKGFADEAMITPIPPAKKPSLLARLCPMFFSKNKPI